MFEFGFFFFPSFFKAEGSISLSLSFGFCLGVKSFRWSSCEETDNHFSTVHLGFDWYLLGIGNCSYLVFLLWISLSLENFHLVIIIIFFFLSLLGLFSFSFFFAFWGS